MGPMTGCTSRRSFMASTGAFVAWNFMPKAANASSQRDPRFLTIILRGALDGMAVVAPVGDPDYPALRRDILVSTAGGLPLNGFFVLNPAMPNLHRLYQSGHALIAHAVASPYRSRSHFDGQDVLESGLPGVGRITDGWLNRTLGSLEKGTKLSASGLAVGPVVPVIMQGKASVTAWAPGDTDDILDQTEMRLLNLYMHTDPGTLSGPKGDRSRGTDGQRWNSNQRRHKRYPSQPRHGPSVQGSRSRGWTHPVEG